MVRIKYEQDENYLFFIFIDLVYIKKYRHLCSFAFFKILTKLKYITLKKNFLIIIFY